MAGCLPCLQVMLVIVIIHSGDCLLQALQVMRFALASHSTLSSLCPLRSQSCSWRFVTAQNAGSGRLLLQALALTALSLAWSSSQADSNKSKKLRLLPINISSELPPAFSEALYEVLAIVAMQFGGYFFRIDPAQVYTYTRLCSHTFGIGIASCCSTCLHSVPATCIRCCNAVHVGSLAGYMGKSQRCCLDAAPQSLNRTTSLCTHEALCKAARHLAMI